MQEAIALVKSDFGAEAVILHTKRKRRGGLWGLLGRTKVEVIAATESRGVGNGRPRAHARLGDVAQRGADHDALEESAAATELARVREELESIKKALDQRMPVGTESPSSLSPKPFAKASEASNAAEAPSQPRGSGSSRTPELHETWNRIRSTLIDQEIHEELADELVTAVRGRVDVDDDETLDEQGVWQEVCNEIAEGISCADPYTLGEEAKVQCLIGPTGVGKTTTIAKLAANYALLANKRVALITVDTYRIAAVEQLKTYAEIIGVPVDVAFSPTELKEAIERRREYDMILVDTAGRSQRNKMQMAELRSFLEVIESPQIHLVLSATTRLKEMLDTLEQFGRLPISYLIVTKLDETTTFGMLYNICRLSDKPLSYVTNGQSVPDDIEVAEAKRVAELIAGVTL